MPAKPHAPRTYTIPKPGGGTRLMAELTPRDALVWRRLAAEAGPLIEPRLGPEVLGNRWDPGSARLRPFRPALSAARAAAHRLVMEAGAVLRTDVQGCYGSIRPDALRASLERARVERGVARAAARSVEAWTGFGVPGLPVGPEPSALFANAVLAPVDATLRTARIRFLRWVDDYLLAPGRRDHRDVLDVLDGALAGVGLQRNRAKTAPQAANAIWPGGAYARSTEEARTMQA
ncbi:MAG: RNA-directed DNA polymerase [Actinomycetota bacterium]